MKRDWRDWVTRFWNTIIWSWQGWAAAWATEMGLRQWSVVVVLSSVLALMLDLNGAERGLIIAMGLMLLAAELMNTAVEKTVDMIMAERHPLAKKAKDCGSAAVALTALAGLGAWVAVLVG